MARVTANEVGELITTSKDVDLFINIANRLVTDMLGASGLSSARLKDIELWLSAHFIAVEKEGGGLLKEKAGTSSVEFNPLIGAEGLALTRFGQQAITLDTTNTLSAAGKKKARLYMI